MGFTEIAETLEIGAEPALGLFLVRSSGVNSHNILMATKRREGAARTRVAHGRLLI